MPALSLSMRTTAYAEEATDVPIVLVEITHPSLAAPVYLSSDPTQRLSTDPLSYGTVSNGKTYLFVLMTAILPDDTKDLPPKTQLALENVDADMAKLIRSFTSFATVNIYLVMASSPNFIERQYTNMTIGRATVDAERVTLDITREPFSHEPFPSARMTRLRFPGLWAR